MFAYLFNRANRLQRIFQRKHLARIDAVESNLAYKPFKVAHVLQFGLNLQFHIFVVSKIRSYLLALMNGRNVFQRQRHPALQHSRAHRCQGVVYHIDKTVSVFVQRRKNLEVAEGETVNPDILILGNALDAGYVAYLCVLCDVKIMQNSAGGYRTKLQLVDAETFERLCLEMLQETVSGGLRRINPLVNGIDVETHAEGVLNQLFVAAFV